MAGVWHCYEQKQREMQDFLVIVWGSARSQKVPPPPIALHLYLCGKSGENERKIIKGVSDLKRAHHASPPAVSASLPSLQPPACAPILRLQVENMGLSPGSPALGGLAIWLHFASSPPLSDGAVGAVCLVGLLERVRNACQVLSPGASAT